MSFSLHLTFPHFFYFFFHVSTSSMVLSPSSSITHSLLFCLFLFLFSFISFIFFFFFCYYDFKSFLFYYLFDFILPPLLLHQFHLLYSFSSLSTLVLNPSFSTTHSLLFCLLLFLFCFINFILFLHSFLSIIFFCIYLPPSISLLSSQYPRPGLPSKVYPASCNLAWGTPRHRQVAIVCMPSHFMPL